MEKDPVCGMTVNPATAKHRATHAGHEYVFCCAGCSTKFSADPAAYLDRPRQPHAHNHAHVHTSPAAHVAGATTYTCPMHPEIVSDAPGTCPICGMALEAAGVPEDAENPEYADMKRRFRIAAILALPVFLLEMGGHIAAIRLDRFISEQASIWIQFALASPVVLWAGAPFFARGWASVRNHSLNMFTLIALGVGTAYLYSLAATFAPGLFPPMLRMHGTIPVYYEAAAVITVLVLLGQVLELKARARTGGAIRALLRLAPKTARRITASGTDTEIPIEEVQEGDNLRIRPGDSVPVDGIVIEGSSNIDESMVTGEAMPVAKQAGDRLIGGTINTTGMLVMQAERVGADTMLSRIVQLVADAQRSRAPIQRLADAVAAWFVPAVIAVALAAFAAWMIWGPRPAFAYAMLAAVSVVIIACPCALGLATPMSIMVGVGRGATEGVLIRNAEALERLEKIDTLVIDKTGTLTEGKPRVTAILPAPGIDEADLLTLAASLEQASEHPLAAAIVAQARTRKLALQRTENFVSETGKGVTGSIGGHQVAIGNEKLHAVTASGLDQQADRLRAQGATVIHITIDSKPAGIIAIADPIKASTQSALNQLRAQNIRIVMLTGDNRTTAQAVGATLGITDIEAEVLPEQKSDIVRRLKAAGSIVAMAGDGVNDAPALAVADVGIAMGSGTEIAIQSAGITLVKGDLSGIVRARALSHATMRNIRQNLVLAFVYNLMGVPIAAGVLYPAFGILLSPIVAAAAMSLSSVSVIGNALRLQVGRIR